MFEVFVYDFVFLQLPPFVIIQMQYQITQIRFNNRTFGTDLCFVFAGCGEQCVMTNGWQFHSSNTIMVQQSESCITHV